MKSLIIVFYSALLTFLMICNVYAEKKTKKEPPKKPNIVKEEHELIPLIPLNPEKETKKVKEEPKSLPLTPVKDTKIVKEEPKSLPITPVNEQLKETKRVDLRKKFGLGAGMGFDTAGVPSPQISLKYWIIPVFGLQLIGGFNVEKGVEQTFINGNTYLVEIENQEYRIGGRANYNVLRRDYLNFYVFGGGGGIIFVSSDEYRSVSGFYIEAGGGAEWFIQWIKGLAFDLEAGIGYRMIGERYAFGDLQNLMGLAGFHYYF